MEYSLWTVLTIAHFAYKCCGSGMFIPDPGSRIRVKKIKYFNPQKMVSKLSEIWSGLSWLVLTNPGSRLPDPGVKQAQDPGSRIRIRNTVAYRESRRTTAPWITTMTRIFLQTSSLPMQTLRFEKQIFDNYPLKSITKTDIRRLRAVFMMVKAGNLHLKGLSHEIDFKTFDKNLQNLAELRDAAGFWIF